MNATSNMEPRNHPNPSSPQYNVFERAAPVETVASPSITMTTEGRQHIEAMSEEPTMYFHRATRGFGLSVPLTTASSMCCDYAFGF